MDSPKAIFVVTGIMASGKSTVSELLAKSFPMGVHIHGDVFRKMVVSGRAEMTPDAAEVAFEQLRLRYRLAATTADAYFESGFTVVVQDVILGDYLQEFVGMLRSSPVYVIALVPAPDVVAQRERQRRKTGYSDGWTPHDMDRTLRHDTPGIGYRIDSSDQTPEETAREILHETIGC